MMPRPKVGVKRKRAGSAERKGAKSKKDQSSDHQEETLVERVTQAVLEALEDRAVPAIPDRSESPQSLDGESDSEITFKEIERSNDEYASSEAIDTFTWSTPISAMVPQKLKQKKLEDQFIDLAVLLPNNLVPGPDSSNYTFKLEKNDNISVVPKKAKQSINSIFQWTTAFLRFVAIYAEKFPNATPNLIKHAETVRDMAASGNVSWQTYDKQIRMDRQIRGTPWGKINVEFMLQAQRSRQENKQSFRSFRTRPGQRSAFTNQLPRGICWSYNREGGCKLERCKFQHICTECKKNHPKTKCRTQAVVKNQSVNSSLGTTKQQ